ncbi:MAG TPA: metallophosphoesterase [Steroidobacteraceae bacterium]|jgi:hypothetical protein
MPQKTAPEQDEHDIVNTPISRRQFFKGAGVAAAATPLGLLSETTLCAEARYDGTPEQIHLSWGSDPARTVFVSWASVMQAINPRVVLQQEGRHQIVVHAIQRTYTDGMNGQTVFTYHARLDALSADTRYEYFVTADNDGHKGSPFGATFRTAPRGRRAFRWTSYGDLSTPVESWVMSSPQSRHAVDAVEKFQPLFHLLNGDLCYANLNPESQPAVWADFGRNVQRSAAARPWMPCPGNHEVEFHNGDQGLTAYLTRYSLPDNGTRFPGHWYQFKVGSVLFICLDANDVIYQDSGAFVTGPDPLHPAANTRHEPIQPGTSLYIRGYSAGAQTRWLEDTLAAAQKDQDLDWIVVQMHQDALSSSKDGNGSDKGLRESWLPLFDRYGVDMVLCGHDHDYERSWPVRGCNHHTGRDRKTGAKVDTLQPQPVVTADPPDGRFNTALGTIHWVLGGGGTASPLDVYGTDPKTSAPIAKVITRRNTAKPAMMPGTFYKPGADAVEEAIWSARRDTVTGYGIAVFDLDPGKPGGETTITMRYFHAVDADKNPTSNYEVFDTVTLVKQRRDAKSR